MKKTITTGIDVGTSSIKVVVSEHTQGENAPRILAMVSKRSKGLRHGYIIDAEETSRSIKEAVIEAEKISGTKIEYAYAGIGGISLESTVADGSVAVSKADMEITDLDIKRAAEASEANLKKSINRHILQTVPIQYKVDGKKALGKPQGMRGETLEVKMLFITCLDQHLQSLVAAIESAGIMIEDVIASPIAASFVTLSRVQKTAGCVLVNIGAETVSIAVFEDGIPISLKVFSIGATDITNDIALGLKIPLEEAEQIKTRKKDNEYSKKKLEDIINARLYDIFDLVESHLKKIGKNGLLPAGAVIVGGGSNISMIDYLAKTSLNLPARIASIPVVFGDDDTKPKEGEIRSIKKDYVDSSWAVAYGLSAIIPDGDFDDSIKSRFIRQTKNSLVEWFRQFLP